jgi:hypothetical protein
MRRTTARPPSNLPWELASLQRLREWQSQLAQAQLAKCITDAQAGRNRLLAAEQAMHQAVVHAGSFSAAAAPELHARVLHHLVALTARLEKARADCAALEAEVTAARASLLRREQAFDTVLAVRDRLLAERWRQVAWRDQKETDDAWLRLAAREDKAL